MATQHHGDNMNGNPELVKLFKDQQKGEATRRWPGGRMGGDDDGQLAYAVAADQKNRAIIIQFPKPVEWLGLDRDSAEQLRDHLTEKLLEIRGIKA